MKRGRIIKLGLAFPIFLGVMVFGAAVWIGYSDREPSYQGKSLSEWLRLHWNSGGKPQYRDAIRSIGTNALPHLMRMAGKKDSPLKVKFWRLLQKQKMVEVGYRSAMVDRSLAISGFEALGAEAKPAVPGLIKLLEDKDRVSRVTVFQCLEKIGSGENGVIPALLGCLDDPQWEVRSKALETLVSVHVPGDEVVPSLIKHLEGLQGQQNGKVGQIMFALGQLGPDAGAATSVLQGFARGTNQAYRAWATHALSRIAPDMVPQKSSEEAVSPYIKRD